MNKLQQRRGLVVAGCATVIAGLASPAAGAQGGVTIIDDTFEFSDVDFCDGPDGTFEIDIAGSGVEVVKFHTRGPNAPLPYFDVLQTTETTYTNPETGLSWSSLNEFHEHDVKVLEVNGDVVTMKVMGSFKFTVFEPSGAVDSYNRGATAFVIDIDTQGTADPADDVGTFVEELFSVGPRTAREFCEDAIRFTLP